MNCQVFCKFGTNTTAISTLLALGGVLTPTSIFAATFNDQNAFDLAASAVGTVALETFDSFAGPVFELPTLGIKFDPLNNGIQPYSVANTCGGFPVSLPNFLINNNVCGSPERGGIVFRPNNASNDIIGVGLFNVSNDDPLQISFFDISNNLIEQTTVLGGPAKFSGIITNNPASRIEISAVGGNGLFAIDNLQIVTKFTQPISVPEPSNIFSLGAIVAFGVLSKLVKKLNTPTDNTQKTDS